MGQARWQRLASLGENMAMYQAESLFTPDELDQVLSMRFKKPTRKAAAVPRATPQQRQALVAQWSEAAAAAREVGSATAKGAFADFSVPPADAQRYLDYAVPFLGWARRAYPKTLEIAAHHPAASAILYRLMQADAANAEAEGRPDWQVGTLPIDTDTPLLGGPLRLLGGGRETEARMNVLQGLVPVPAATLGGASDLEGATTGVDVARAALDVAGAGFSPLVETAAYAAGLTDKAPRSASRTSGFEQAAPGPTLPSLSNGALNFLREQQGKFGISDPLVNVAKELVFERTGRPVSDPGNKQYALDILNRTGIYDEAKAVYEAGGAVRNAVALVNPTGLSVQSATSAAAREALANRPVSPAALALLRQTDPQQAVAATRANAEYKAQYPVAAVYDNATLTPQDRQDPRLTAWEARYSNLKAIAPSAYAQMRAEFMRANRIKG